MSQTKLMGGKIIECLISKMISISSLKYPVTSQFFKFHFTSFFVLFFFLMPFFFIIKDLEGEMNKKQGGE